MKSAIDIQAKLFQESIVEHIDSLSFDALSSSQSPLIVELDPTAACDLACPGCISEDIISEGGRFSNERLISLGHEMVNAGVKGVILIGGGEPLAHPKIGELIELLGHSGVSVGITTNGTFLDRHINEVSKFSSWTRVSFDAASKQMFDKLRPSKGGRSKYWKILENMRLLAKVKKGKLGFSFLIQTPADGPAVPSNVEEIYIAAVLARDIGCDYFEVKPSYQWRENAPHALMKHDRLLMERAREQIYKSKELDTNSFKVYEAINLEASLNGVENAQNKTYHRCPAAELRTLVTPKGGYICPYWRGKSDMRIGDYNTQSFSAVWSGMQRQIVMDRVNPKTTCNFHCLRHTSNETVLRIKEALENNKNIDTTTDYDIFI